MKHKIEKFLVIVFGIAFNIGIYIIHLAAFNDEFRLGEIFNIIGSVFANFWLSTITLLLSIVYLIYIHEIPFELRMVVLTTMIIVAAGASIIMVSYSV